MRQHLDAIESYATRRATERPYMSPEERLAKIEEHIDAALKALDESPRGLGDQTYRVGSEVRLVSDPAVRSPEEQEHE